MKTLVKVNYQYEVMIEYESKLPNITPDMAFWWWDHMGPIERYRLWSPNHLAFEWEIDPSVHGRVGAIHSVTEYVGAIPVYLRLRYEDPSRYPGSRKYKHAIVESSLTHDDHIMGWILHEFDEAGNGLIDEKRISIAFRNSNRDCQWHHRSFNQRDGQASRISAWFVS